MSKKESNKWTVMVYLAGDNNLAEEMVYAMKTMQLIGSNPPDYEVCVYYEGANGKAQIVIDDPRGAAISGLLEQAEESRKAESIRQLETATKERQEAAKAESSLQHTQIPVVTDPDAPDPPASPFSRRLSTSLETHVSRLLNSNSISPGKSKKGAYSTKTSNKNLINAAGTEIVGVVERVFHHHQKLEDASARLQEAKVAEKEAKEARNKEEPIAEDSVQLALEKFILQSIEEHPAEKYMLVLSGHGSGSVGDFLVGASRFTGLSIPDLGEVLKSVQEKRKKSGKEKENNPKIDILGLDSCLMGNAELAYEVRDYVDYMVGAEGFEPNTGWPYDEILKLLQRNAKTIEAKDLAIAIVEKYISFYHDYALAEVSTDMSAIDLSKIKHFALAFAGPQGLSTLLKKAIDPKRPKQKDAVVLAHWEVQDYKNEQHIDVTDFCELLQGRFSGNQEIVAKCKKVISAVRDLRLSYGYVGPAFQYSKGLSVYFPWANVTDAVGVRELDHYRATLSFGKETKWADFLSFYHEKTQRPVRPGEDPEHSSALNRCEGLFTGPVGNKTLSGAPGARTLSGAPGARTLSGAPGARTLSGAPGARTLSGAPGARIIGFPRIGSMKNPPIRWKDPFKDPSKDPS